MVSAPLRFPRSQAIKLEVKIKWECFIKEQRGRYSDMLLNSETLQHSFITINLVIALKHTKTKSQRGGTAGGHFSPAALSFTFSFLK